MACHGLHVWSLYMNHALSHGNQGISPCSYDHREAAGPVYQAADLVLSFVVTQHAPFERFVTASIVRPSPGGNCQSPHVH